MGVSSNFDFLAAQDERFARLGAMAERYFFDDAPAALIKLRQLGEFIAKDVAARHGLLPKNTVSFEDVLRTLKLRSVLPGEVAELFYHLKRLGNAAAHEDAGTAGRALTALKIAGPSRSFNRSTGPRPASSPAPSCHSFACRCERGLVHGTQEVVSFGRVPTTKPRPALPTRKQKQPVSRPAPRLKPSNASESSGSNTPPRRKPACGRPKPLSRRPRPRLRRRRRSNSICSPSLPTSRQRRSSWTRRLPAF